jgi:molybdopterin-guanine dinucleotide biosynthesis protein MobB
MRRQSVVCIIGTGRHVGKTSILIGVLKEMKRRKLAVGTVKHIGGHSAFDFKDKDTSKHIQAGSTVTLALTSSEIVTIRRDLSTTLEVALTQMPKELDYILVEGFRQSKYPKIIVVNSESEFPQGVQGDTIAVVINQQEIRKGGQSGRVERFSDRNLVDMIEDYFSSSEVA